MALISHSSPDSSSFRVYTRAARCPAAGYCWSADCDFELKSQASAERGSAPDLAAGMWGLNPDLSTDSGEMVMKLFFVCCHLNF